MVCEKCEKKLTKVIVPDKWKEGASNTNESGGRKINENKLLSKKNRYIYSSKFFNHDLIIRSSQCRRLPCCIGNFEGRYT
ncbi:uncharacterized protein LOC131154550 isoform X2 [Malania oleifera]|uniref:uncharacterized protein LOC131154550 isoform X2 n=1 Tax=Malania oleifera TaxID=397392 RepID=UPI0025AE4665|nr:uncharacterized protein LOC131154550 isoform X2 [Malania oleifera]